MRSRLYRPEGPSSISSRLAFLWKKSKSGSRFFFLFLTLGFLQLNAAATEIPGAEKANNVALDELHVNPIDLSGTVTDSISGEALVGVTVRVKGASKGAVTDANGQYHLSGIQNDATIVISYISYQPKTIAVNGRTKIDIQLASASQQLNELVVTALGIKK